MSDPVGKDAKRQEEDSKAQQDLHEDYADIWIEGTHSNILYNHIEDTTRYIII